MKQTPEMFRYARHIIAFIIVVGAFSFLFVLAYRSVPDTNKDIINMAAGGILALLAGVGAYYFGSSKDKSDAESSARQETTSTTTSTTTPAEVIEKHEIPNRQ